MAVAFFLYPTLKKLLEHMKQFLNDKFFDNNYEEYKNNIQKYVDQNDPNFPF